MKFLPLFITGITFGDELFVAGDINGDLHIMRPQILSNNITKCKNDIISEASKKIWKKTNIKMNMLKIIMDKQKLDLENAI